MDKVVKLGGGLREYQSGMHHATVASKMEGGEEKRGRNKRDRKKDSEEQERRKKDRWTEEETDSEV